MKKITLLLFIVICSFNIVAAKENVNPKQFIYVLRLEKAMYDSAAWTPEKSKIVQEHFAYLQKLHSDGILVLAGRAETDLDKTFGIVVFEAASLEEAKLIAESDPAVKNKIMNVEVFPFGIALLKGSIK